MTQLIVFVEEESAEAALGHLLPRLIRGRCTFKVINLQNKSNFLKVIESRLRGYAEICERDDLRFVLLVDRDADDCVALKEKLETAARRAGLPTRRARARDGTFRLVTRIVVEELESWFLGDPDALCAAYTKLPRLNTGKRPFANPDNGGTWEELEKLLRKHGYPKRYAKIDGARRIAGRMDPDRNRSTSFQAFRAGVEDLLSPPA
ncbi:DUF4276 family protein [Salinarimonas chemoclinalis]|uniref:DUF4276 family protein n=1 Tax=Salinarimonas chemoclinalis TaxID=3241599 RepID=UPI003556BC6C